MMYSPQLVIAFAVIGIVSCFKANKVEISEKNWTDVDGTVILGYRHGVFDEDKLATAICRSKGEKKYIVICDLEIQLPRFSNNIKKWTTTLRSSSNEGKPILPERLSSVNSTIILPWRDNHTAHHDVLNLRLIDMTSHKEVDIKRKVAKNSDFLVVPFADSFELFYKIISDETEDYKRYRKEAFNESGAPIGDPVSIFQNLLPEEAHRENLQASTLGRAFAVSNILRSSGYFLVSAERAPNETIVLTLNSDGTKGGSLRLDFDIFPDLSCYGQNAILFENYVNKTTYRYVILDGSLNVVSDLNYTTRNGSTLVDSFLVDYDRILFVICDDVKKKSNDTQSLACSLELLYTNIGLSDTVSIPYFLDEKNPWQFPHILSSYVDERTCINIFFTHENGIPYRMKTICASD